MVKKLFDEYILEDRWRKGHTAGWVNSFYRWMDGWIEGLVKRYWVNGCTDCWRVGGWKDLVNWKTVAA